MNSAEKKEEFLKEIKEELNWIDKERESVTFDRGNLVGITQEKVKLLAIYRDIVMEPSYGGTVVADKVGTDRAGSFIPVAEIKCEISDYCVLEKEHGGPCIWSYAKATNS